MRRLPFERDYLLEYARCDRCGGAGVVTRVASNDPKTCLNCRGLGRKITRAGRELFYEICELLGKPVLEKESRIKPKHLQRIYARQLRPGMYVKRVRRSQERYRLVEAVESEKTFVRIRYVDGDVVGVPDLETFDRELTDAEIASVSELMAQRVGDGAVTGS